MVSFIHLKSLSSKKNNKNAKKKTLTEIKRRPSASLSHFCFFFKSAFSGLVSRSRELPTCRNRGLASLQVYLIDIFSQRCYASSLFYRSVILSECGSRHRLEGPRPLKWLTSVPLGIYNTNDGKRKEKCSRIFSATGVSFR